MNSHKEQDELNLDAVRKPYVSPKLQVFGDLRQITQHVGNKGNDDGAANAPKKTSAG